MNAAASDARLVAGALAVGAMCVGALPQPPAAGADLTAAQALEQIRQAGDVAAERQHVWALLADITGSAAGSASQQPMFETWHGEGELFGSPSLAAPRPGIAGFYRTDGAAPTLDPPPDVPVLTYTLYNDPAFRHIDDNQLNRKAGLEALLASGPADATITGDRAVPQFPTSAVVMKTVWWPVAGTGVTAMPVWDPADNPPLGHGNAYTTWHRVVGVDPGSAAAGTTVAVDFVGTHYAGAHRVPLDALYHVPVDADLARRVMADPPSAKAMLIALGRSLQAGDYLALVGINIATREDPRLDLGDRLVARPARPGAVCRRPAGDADRPVAQLSHAAGVRYGSPGRRRRHAPYRLRSMARGPLPRWRGGSGRRKQLHVLPRARQLPADPVPAGDARAAGYGHDPAFAPGRLRTSLLWGLAMHAQTTTVKANGGEP